MINLRTKAEGMKYVSNQGVEYDIHHGYFKVIDFEEVPGENKYRIHVQNQEYDTVVTPYIDNKETLTKGCNIKMAYIITDQGINCHGYEVITEDRPELEWGNLPPHKELIIKNVVDEQYYRRLLKFFINRITNEPLRNFVNNILEKKSDRFYKWPAAHGVHHNYPGGLLQHTANVVKNAYSIGSNYNDIDMDIVLVGAILHDIGKIYEYDEKGDISGEGKLFDHINIGTRIVFEEYYHGEDSVYSFSERDLYHIAHIILSHHGKLEWGSPRTPATQEAFIVHYADYIDTNMFITHRELLPLDIDQNVKSKYSGNLMRVKFDMNQDYDKTIDFI